MALLIAFGSPYHSRLTGSDSKMRSTPRLSLRGCTSYSARIGLRCETTSIVLVAHTQVNLLGLCFSVKHSEPLPAALNPYTRAVVCPRGFLPCECAMHCNLVGYNRDLSFRECYFVSASE